MARTKRKRTRAEIEQAWEDYQLANGAPDGPEEPAAKARRFKRTGTQKSRLNKELESLEDDGSRLGDTSGGVTPAQSVPVNDAERQRVHRAGRSQEVEDAERERSTTQRQILRASLTQEAQDAERERNTERRRVLRAEPTPQEQEGISEQERARREAEEDEARKETARVRRKCVRRGHALANHEDFDKSMVSGKNISNGHHVLPAMYPCGYCGAWKWPGESGVSCCLQGRVQLSPLLRAPEYLHEYYKEPEFKRCIRAYNQVFAFTSIGVARTDGVGVRGVREDTSVQGQRGVYTYRVQGAMGHYLGSLLPRMDYNGGEFTPAKFAQIYIMDEDMKKRAERRNGIFAGLDREKLTTLERMMDVHNPFAQQFLSHGEKIRRDIEEGKDVVDVKYELHADKRRSGTTNLPTVNEVGAVIVDDGNFNKERDLLLYTTRNGLLRIFETNPMYDPLQYPLLFPRGELGWTYTDQYADGKEYKGKTKLSLREHVAYRLFPKDDGSAPRRALISAVARGSASESGARHFAVDFE
ncbi:hypothetical protein PR003_g22744 [Phytophthora rubi]|uniref:Helitron helicase-like domain-containing protein n=1 Tax=Phytophthora rubi TaxID=129364 RepID=A0A6A4D1B3_9STRA|nr:hypothetical protein PR003_g22744 [Phytophthora rubi]